MARDGGGGGGGVSLAAPAPLHEAEPGTMAPTSDVENEQEQEEEQSLSICRRRSIGAAAVAANGSAPSSSPPLPGASSPRRRPVRMLLIDNYDSYTYNLFQLMSMVNGAQPDVIHNDALPWPQLRSRILAREWDGVVISPGPGTPLVPNDVGVCAPLFAEAASSSSSSPPSSSRFPPILGVCLGMQALAHACGGLVRPAPEPVHGRLSLVEHCGSSPLFAGMPPREVKAEEGCEKEEKTEAERAANLPSLPPPFRVVRYHSLAVDEGSLPPCLRATAWTVGGTVAVETKSAKKAAAPLPVAGVVPSPSSSSSSSQRVLMALEHASLPLFGVQFHPESVATSYGDALFANFRDLVAERAGLEKGCFKEEEEGKSLPRTPGPATPAAKSSASSSSSSSRSPFPCPAPSSTLELCWEKVEGCLESAGGTESLFLRLFNRGAEEAQAGAGAATAATAAASSSPYSSTSPSPSSLRLLDHGAPDVWWLDTATSDRGRFSFMGGGPSGGHAGPLWSRALYRLGSKKEENRGNTLSVTTRDGTSRSTSSSSSSVFDALELQLRACAREPDPLLPFDFQGGFLALLGYELKAECGGEAAHSSSFSSSSDAVAGSGTATPDAAFFFADRMLAADHATGDVYCLALYEEKEKKKQKEEKEEDEEEEGKESTCSPSAEKREALSWVSRLSSRVRSLAAAAGDARTLPPPLASVAGNPPPPSQQQRPFRVRRGRATYLEDVSSCLGALARGESYELCLTTRLEQEGPPPPALALYRELRRGNPAPYSAFVALGGDEVKVLTSSPSFSPFSSIDGYCGPRICCSSPERFLRGSAEGRLEARPIKGTARRVLPPTPGGGADGGGGDGDDEQAVIAAAEAADAAVASALASSEKDRAENLMIVDLLRNDLGRVSEPGSVSVPGLMEVETFATVHQLVSTVVGVARGMGGTGGGGGGGDLGWARAVAEAAEAGAEASSASITDPLLSSSKKNKDNKSETGDGYGDSKTVTSPVAAVRAAFPGGSMTGAPKVRSMALLDALEKGSRGLYSGSLGYLSTTGAFDLNIVIRTAVLLPRAAAEAAADEAARNSTTTTTRENGCSSSPSPPRLLPPGISIGAGGAVVLQSTPEGEYEEMLLKAGALLAAVSKVSSSGFSLSSSSSASSPSPPAPPALVED